MRYPHYRRLFYASYAGIGGRERIDRPEFISADPFSRTQTNTQSNGLPINCSTRYFAMTVAVAIVCPLIGLTSEKVISLLTQSPVWTEPLAGRPAANRTPATQICKPLYPGAFQLSVVWPTVVPGASTIGFGFAEKVT